MEVVLRNASDRHCARSGGPCCGPCHVAAWRTVSGRRRSVSACPTRFQIPAGAPHAMPPARSLWRVLSGGGRGRAPP